MKNNENIKLNVECGMRNEEFLGMETNSSFRIPHSSLTNDSSFLIPHSSLTNNSSFRIPHSPLTNNSSFLIPHFSFLIVPLLLLISSCTSVKSFMARDLDDEDFVIGQLYADERYDETPLIAEPVDAKPQRLPDGSDCNNALGLHCNPSDNETLYREVNSWLGTPYRYGGNDRNGIDCSAFVAAIYKKVYGSNLHRTANDMLQDVTLVAPKDIAEGDILFFTNSKGKVSHVGIYLKDGLFAHSSTSAGVCVSRLDDTYWKKHFYRGGRVK